MTALATGFGSRSTPQATAADRLRIPAGISTALLVLVIAYSAMEVWASLASPVISAEALDALITIEELGPWLIIANMIAFVVWSYMAHSNLDSFERHDQTHVHQATIWWWICPVANLWMPFRVVYETARGSFAPQGTANWKQTRLSALAMWWTALFILGIFSVQVSSAMISTALTLDDLEAGLVANGAAYIVYGIAAAAAIALIWQITRAQQDLATLWTGGPTNRAEPHAESTGSPNQVFAAPTKSTQFCTACGHEWASGDSFCGSCGSRRR